MSESDQVLARREAVRETYGVLYDEVARILFLHDPMGIAFETKTDEYESPRVTCSATCKHLSREALAAVPQRSASICAPRSASTSSTTTKSVTIRAWTASSSRRPPTSTSLERSSAENAWAGSCASIIPRQPEA
jgi:hypothetical protein